MGQTTPEDAKLSLIGKAKAGKSEHSLLFFLMHQQRWSDPA
jgi:hypothetical protein